jgi:hypothetical protein
MSSFVGIRLYQYSWIATYFLLICRKRSYAIQNGSEKCFFKKIKINSYKSIGEYCLVNEKIIIVDMEIHLISNTLTMSFLPMKQRLIAKKEGLKMLILMIFLSIKIFKINLV